VRTVVSHLRAHPHLVVSTAAGIVAGLLAVNRQWGGANAVSQGLIGWNFGAWVYLLWAAWTMSHADHGHLIRTAKAQAEGAGVVLAIVTSAALACLGAVVVELSAAKAAGPSGALPHVLFALVTVISSWLLVPTLFTLNYASLYHGSSRTGGLNFQDSSANFEPDYSDFLYFSFTIAVASQTADVAITSRIMRRLALKQALLSFVFNTTILAFTINMAASLF
jgi:uncharacterized membrane protein